METSLQEQSQVTPWGWCFSANAAWWGSEYDMGTPGSTSRDPKVPRWHRETLMAHQVLSLAMGTGAGAGVDRHLTWCGLLPGPG